MLHALSPRVRTVLLIGLAAAMLLGFRVAQEKWSTGTFIYCQAEMAQTYACHVWLRLWRRGSVE